MIRLAEIRELECIGFDILFPRGSILATVEGMREYLYAFEPGQELSVSGEPAPEELEDFYTFHGREASTVSGVDVPSRWKRVGEVRSVLYRSDKLHGGGNGTPQLFRHKFDRGTTAARSLDNPSWIRIYGAELYVSDRGITN